MGWVLKFAHEMEFFTHQSTLDRVLELTVTFNNLKESKNKNGVIKKSA
jgi:hypothetical protein